MKFFIHNTKLFLEQNISFSNQSKWEFLKNQKSREQNADLLCKIAKLEQDIDSEEKFEEYDKTRSELEKIYDKTAEGVKIRSKCSWYQYSEKIFYGLEKKNAICGTIKTLINYGKEITMPNEIKLTLKSFYENLFQKDMKKHVSDIETF